MNKFNRIADFVSSLEQKELTNEQQAMLLGAGTEPSPVGNNCQCNGDDCKCHGDNCNCNTTLFC